MKNDQKLSKENEGKIDRISRSAADAFDAIKPDLNHQRIWNSIFERLNHIDKKILSWFFAIATSISLLVASSFDIYNYGQQLIAPSTVPVVEIELANNTPIVPLPKQVIKEEIQSIKLNTQVVAEDIRTIKKIEIPAVASINMVAENMQNNNIHLTRWNAFVGVNLQNNLPSPEIGVAFDLFKIQKKDKTHKISLGISTRLVKIMSGESLNTKFQPSTYANIIYTHSNDTNRHSWSAKTGFLLNPDGEMMKNTTVKFSALKSLTPHIFIGPELIFTDGFKKTYPGISLVFNT